MIELSDVDILKALYPDGVVDFKLAPLLVQTVRAAAREMTLKVVSVPSTPTNIVARPRRAAKKVIRRTRHKTAPANDYMLLVNYLRYRPGASLVDIKRALKRGVTSIRAMSSAAAKVGIIVDVTKDITKTLRPVYRHTVRGPF